MIIKYDLINDEADEVEFIIRLICDRQDRPGFYAPIGHKDHPEGGEFETPYTLRGRIDMFWIKCKLHTFDLGDLLVEPKRADATATDFSISRNHCDVVDGYQRLAERAKAFFRNSPEYKQQCAWMKSLLIKVEQDKADNFTEPRLVIK